MNNMERLVKADREGLKIIPANITLESSSEDACHTVCLQNPADRPVMYKFRTPPSEVIVVSEPKGLLPAGSKRDIKLNYHSERNMPPESHIPAQVKYVMLQPDDTEDTSTGADNPFEKHKANVKTAYLGLTFSDQMDMEDAMFKSPAVNSRWWKKQ